MSTTDALPARPVQWSVGEVAEYLGVQASTVRAYVARGEMPEPDGRVWRTPWWWDGTIIAWQQARPGRARTWRGLNAAARASVAPWTHHPTGRSRRGSTNCRQRADPARQRTGAGSGG